MRSSALMLIAVVLLGVCTSIVHARQWTDNQGRAIEARFVRMHEGSVVLMKGKKVLKVDFYQLSEADQQYLRDELDKMGLSYQILPPRANNQPPGEGSPQQGAGQPPVMSAPSAPNFGPPRGMGGRMGGMPDINAMMREVEAESARFHAEAQQRHRQMVEDMERRRNEPPLMGRHSPRPMPHMSTPAHASSGSSMPSTMQHASVAPPMSSSMSTPPSMSSAPASPGYTPSMPSSPAPQVAFMQKVCESCDNPVPDSSTVGGKCPHCGVRWDYDETDPDAGSSWRGRRLAIKGAVFLVFIVGGFIVKFFKGGD